MREIAELTAKINLLLAMNSVSNAELARRDEMLTQLHDLLAQKDNMLAEKDRKLTEKDSKILDLTNEVASLRASTIWRLTAPIRSTTNYLRQLQNERRRD